MGRTLLDCGFGLCHLGSEDQLARTLSLNTSYVSNYSSPLHFLYFLVSVCVHTCVCAHVCVHAKLLQWCPTLWDPMYCSLPGSFGHRILQARILECVAMPSPGDLPYPGIKPVSLVSPAFAGGFFINSATWKAHGCVFFLKFL